MTETSPHSTLSFAGYGYLVGDAALCAAKLLEGDKMGAGGALLWGLGGAAAARYGHPKREKQLQLFEHQLGDFLRSKGVVIPDSPTTAELAKPGGVIEHIESFLYRYPSQMLNAVFAAGGLMTLKGGLHVDALTGKRNKMDIASGALVVAGALAGLLIQEKKADPDHRPEGWLEHAKQWVQEKPLRVSGALYHINNVSMIMGGFEQMKKAPAGQTHWLRFSTAASYIFANTLLALSTKEHGAKEEDAAMLERICAESAQVVAAQKPELRASLIDTVAHFISEQKKGQQPAQEISALLQEKLAELPAIATQESHFAGR